MEKGKTEDELVNRGKDILRDILRKALITFDEAIRKRIPTLYLGLH